MKTLKTLIAITLVGITTVSCQKVVDLKVDDPDPQVAVEGMISNHLNESYVKLEWTKPYFSKEAPKPVINARVVIMDGNGANIPFQETTAGFYIAPAGFTGKPGTAYQLDVKYNGGTLQATATMPDTVSILNLELVKANAEDPRLDAGYYLYGTLGEQPRIRNYFKAETFVNGVKNMITADDIEVFNDEYFENQGYVPVELNFWPLEDDKEPGLHPGDSISLKVWSISQQGFEYYSALSDTPMQGGIFGKNPANLPSNIEGGLGWFQASSYTQIQKLRVGE